MPRLYNVDHQPQLINPVSGERAVMPGESYDFTDEQAAAGIAGSWSDTDPREGLADEHAFKLARDHTREQLDEHARQVGVTPDGMPTKQAVADAIHAALAEQAHVIEDVAGEPAETTDPAEPEKE